MMINKKKVYIFIVLILAVFALINWQKIFKNSSIEKEEWDFQTATNTTSTLLPQINKTETSTSKIEEEKNEATTNSPKDRAWRNLKEYMNLAKQHDIVGVERLSYKISDTCKDPKKQKECNDLMDGVAELISEFKYEYFNNVYFDSKQIILFSDEITINTDISKGYVRDYIYFIIDDKDNVKILAIELFKGEFVRKERRTDVEVDDLLRRKLSDKDEDALIDDFENCVNLDNQASGCQKTDPLKKDTDGNGFWDSIDILTTKTPNTKL